MRVWTLFCVTMMACDPGAPLADETALQAIDDAFCDLATVCWQLYDAPSDCIVDNALAEETCDGAPAVAAIACEEALREQADACVPLAEFTYPAVCQLGCAR